MRRLSARRHFRAKLLLSYGLVVAVGIGGLVLGVRLVGPSLFDRMLGHMGRDGGMMSGGMSEALRRETAAAFQTAVLQALLLSTAAATVTAIGVSVLVSRRITAPVTRMVAVSRRLARGDYRARVPVEGQDELGELAAGFNDMAAALEDAERRRVHLIGDVAHELRTPLATLGGYLEGLLDDVVEPTPELWEQLHGETTRLNRLVDDLQELSRVEAGRVALHRQPVAPARLVDAALARLAPSYAEKGVWLRDSVPDGVPDVVADKDRAIQVLSNLLTNALRFTPPGGEVTLTARADARAVRFQVRDTGVGISEEHLPSVFDRFFRVDPSRSRRGGGSGIGLTIAKALVEAQGGRIWAASAGPGKGATFSFTLPVARDRRAAGSRANRRLLPKENERGDRRQLDRILT